MMMDAASLVCVKCLVAWQTARNWAVDQANVRHLDEAGEASTEHVVWIGIFVLIVIAAGALITKAVMGHANTVVSHINSQP